MTDIDRAVVEKAIRDFGVVAEFEDEWPDGYDDEQQSLMRSAMTAALQAVNLPNLLRKEREYDEMQMQLAGLTAQYEHATAYTVVHRGALIYCSDAMRQAYSDQTVALDALLARVEAAPVGRRYEIAVGDWIVTPDEWAEIDMPCKRVRLLVEQEG